MPPKRLDRGQVLAALNGQLAALGRPAYSGPDPMGECVRAVLAAFEADSAPQRPAARAAVRHALDLLVERAPGRSVEVRIPPYAAVQAIEGPGHTRGTPPNVVETDPRTWLELVTGRTAWADAVRDGRVSASGSRADLSGYVPLMKG